MRRVVPKRGYVTTDGQFFEGEQEAYRHQEEIDKRETAESFIQEVRKKTGFLIPYDGPLMKSIQKEPHVLIGILNKHYGDSK